MWQFVYHLASMIFDVLEIVSVHRCHSLPCYAIRRCKHHWTQVCPNRRKKKECGRSCWNTPPKNPTWFSMFECGWCESLGSPPPPHHHLVVSISCGRYQCYRRAIQYMWQFVYHLASMIFDVLEIVSVHRCHSLPCYAIRRCKHHWTQVCPNRRKKKECGRSCWNTPPKNPTYLYTCFYPIFSNTLLCVTVNGVPLIGSFWNEFSSATSCWCFEGLDILEAHWICQFFHLPRRMQDWYARRMRSMLTYIDMITCLSRNIWQHIHCADICLH